MNRQNKFLFVLLFVSVFFTGFFFRSPITYAATPRACKNAPDAIEAETKTKPTYIIPELNIQIPGLEKFNEPILTANGIESTFLSQYLTGLYRFLIGASITIAIIMVMIGGFQYVLSAGGADAGKAKTRISNAVIGLVLLLSVYLILYTANPQLTIFKAVALKNVDLVNFDFGPETLTDKDIKGGGSYPYQYFKAEGCPVNLTNKDFDPSVSIKANVPRRVEFHEKIKPQITGTIIERVMKSVEATTRCHIQYENCGVGSTNMYALAAKSGSKSDACLTNTWTGKKKDSPNGQFSCNYLGYPYGNIHKQTKHDASNDKTKDYGIPVSQLLAGFYCGSVAKCGCINWPEPCIKDKAEAAKKLAKILSDAGDWSPNWVDEMEPGDYYMIVNWNPSCQSTHSAMFLGWKDKGSRTAWVEMADAKHFLRIGTKQFDAEDLVIQISKPID